MNNIISSNQRNLIYDYSYKNRPRFNEKLISRSDDEIIQEILKVVFSCQRDKFFLIRLDSYRVVDDPIEIENIMFQSEKARISNSNNNAINRYEFIDMRESDIRLLVLNYSYGIKDDIRQHQVVMAIPKVVNKYYFRIMGNLYCPMYQLVDSSTYNNAISNKKIIDGNGVAKKKKDTVSMKTMFMPIRVTRDFIKLNYGKEKVNCIVYVSKIFSKEVDALKYIISKIGIYNTFQFLGIHCIGISTEAVEDENFYSFYKNGIFINVPKMIFDRNEEVQSLVGTIYNFIEKNTKYEDVFSQVKWLESLGSNFGSDIKDKGISVLESLEGLYDQATYESINIDHRHKENIYCIIRWLTREFSNLMIKSTLDISTKKIRCAEYIASLYARKLSKGIHNMSHEGKKITHNTIKKYLNVPIMFLVKEITKCPLINYKNIVNDLDAFLALKYSYKGPSGLGSGKSNTVSNVYRGVNVTEIGIVDMDSCNKSDPGTQGNFTPMMDTDFFSQYKEPSTWEDDFNQIMNEYDNIKKLKEVVQLKKNLLGNYDEEYDHLLDDHYEAFKRLIEPIVILEERRPIDPVSFIGVQIDFSGDDLLEDDDEDDNKIRNKFIIMDSDDDD